MFCTLYLVDCFHFVYFFLWSFFLLFHLGNVAGLLLLAVSLYFFSMCEVDLKSLPVLSGWGYVVGVLWGTVVQCPLSSEPGASGLCSVWVVDFSCCSLDYCLHISGLE